MERKYTIPKKLASLLINKVHEGNEKVEANGDRFVDVLLDYDDPFIVNDLLTDVMNNQTI